MPRNMSFMLTTQQAYEQTKDVTRRLGWWFAKKGDVYQQVEKGQGLKKGEKVKRIHLIKVVSADPEPLYAMLANVGYGLSECFREGFPEMSPDQFVWMFCKANKCTPDTEVNRIEFTYTLSDEDRAFLKQVPGIA